MLTDAKLKALTGVVDPTTGILWALPADGSPPVAVTYPNGVNLEFRNLLNASIILYRIVGECEEVLNALHDFFAEQGIEQLIAPVTNTAASCQVARRCAIEGLEKIAARREKGG
jgi:hypothetical protein